MNILIDSLYILTVLSGGVLALLVGYLLLLMVAAWLAPTRTPLGNGEPQHRFALLVPAYNEEKLLPTLLKNLKQLNYPKSHYTVYLVADNCTDSTAEIGRQAGATVHERFNTEQIGKGYALGWLLQRIIETEQTFDAAVILDADSVVSENYLTVMNAKLSTGAKVIQSYDGVLDVDSTWAVGLRLAAMAVINYLRPQGRSMLGGSVGLKGNGMVFHHEILKQHEWSASVTEDIEYHMALILAGERVVFAPDAAVLSEMPSTLGNSQTQNVRWEQGRLEMAKAYIPRLMAAAWQQARQANWASAYLLFDAALEHIIPPFSILMGLSLLYLGSAFWWGIPWMIGLASIIVLGQALYLVSGLVLIRASFKTYLALLYSPIFIIWKIWLYIRILLKFEQQGWVRTARDQA